jgi:hypothetical protein
LSGYETKCRGEYLDLKVSEYQAGEENYIMRSFIICTTAKGLLFALQREEDEIGGKCNCMGITNSHKM